MAVQTTYAINHGEAYAGLMADMNPAGLQSKINLDTVDIAYGKGVVTSGEDGAVLPTGASTAAEFIGVAMRELNRVTANPGTTYAAPQDRDMTVLTHGIIWVTATETVVKDEDVFLRVGATNTGDFANAAGSGATLSVQIADAKFLTGGGTGDLVKISLGLGG